MIKGRGWGEIKRDGEVSEGMHFYFYELRAINKTFRGAEKKDKNDKRKICILSRDVHT